MIRLRHVLPLMLGVLAAITLACSSNSSSGSGSGLRVVAAENFWGSIAKQLGGNKVNVTSIISNPNTDPHDYEATPKDGRTVADARYLISNGIGYDPWVSKLAGA